MGLIYMRLYIVLKKRAGFSSMYLGPLANRRSKTLSIMSEECALAGYTGMVTFGPFFRRPNITFVPLIESEFII